jgi:hypothetical protein
MNPWRVIQHLYDSEINAGIAADWDGGLHAWIGAGQQRLTERTFGRDEFDQVGPWLDSEARRLFPDSSYARNQFDSPEIPHGDPLWRNVLGRRQSETRKPGP